MNETIARALAEDAKRRGGSSETIEFHDNDAVYTISVKVEKTFDKSVRDSRGGILSMSGGSGGSACTCCSGTGRA